MSIFCITNKYKKTSRFKHSCLIVTGLFLLRLKLFIQVFLQSLSERFF